MTHRQAKYLLKIILFLGAVFYAINLYTLTYWYSRVILFGEYLLLITNVLVVLTVFTTFIYYFNRTKWLFRLTFTSGSIALLLILSQSFQMVAFEYHQHQMSKIYAINSCEKAEEVFQTDLESNDLKYFLFGMGVDEQEYDYLSNEYHLDVYSMGCIGNSSLICYNQLVENHVQSKTHKEFWSSQE